ncbi:MAG: HAMP domain-containing histidine kinase [Alphaproteobacteria bacterium]|nr:HAMP domain-containing histidine kinase [Alphaproteobacteria bacterium]
MLLSKTLRSSTLRLAFIYVFVFSALIFGLLGYVYWSTLSYLYEKSDRATTAEHTLLLDDLDRFRAKIAMGLGTGAGLFLLLATAAGISTSRRSVARIEAINSSSRKIMRAGLGERIPVRGTGDEWDGLAENLNSMLDRIEELVETNKQVSDNIAHDLRTPLARMRGRLERACNQELDLRQYRSLVNNTIAELDEILRTFSSLLRISRIEASERLAGFRPLDLSGLTREVVELFEPSAEEKAIELKLSETRPIYVVGDRDLLFDAVSNLIDNAIKHGSKKSKVGIAVRCGGEGPVLSIADRGPGIPVEERNNVFKRFYRLERSRKGPGNGLGLSLVAAVAHLHDARIELADNAPGLRIALHFPCLESELHDGYDERSNPPLP